MKAVAAIISNRRGRLLAPIVCAAAMAGGCATKRDVRDLQMELGRMRAQQDSLYQEIRRQNTLLADSVRGGAELVRSTRAQLSNQIRQLNDVVLAMQQLLGQTQQRITELRERAEAAQQPAGETGNAEELYRAGASKLQEKSATAARIAFEQFLTQYSTHELAPDAQFGLAETYVLDGELEAAVTNFVRVAEAYPTSNRAAEALYRAGRVSEERNRRTDARTYYQRVIQRYANSDSARLARERLNRLR